MPKEGRLASATNIQGMEDACASLDAPNTSLYHAPTKRDGVQLGIRKVSPEQSTRLKLVSEALRAIPVVSNVIPASIAFPKVDLQVQLDHTVADVPNIDPRVVILGREGSKKYKAYVEKRTGLSAEDLTSYFLEKGIIFVGGRNGVGWENITYQFTRGLQEISKHHRNTDAIQA